MQDFRILDGGAGSELQDLGFHVNVSIYLCKSDLHETTYSTVENGDLKENLFESFDEWEISVHYLSCFW